MSEALIPTFALRWFVDYDGERILQQRFQKPSGGDLWKAVEDVDFYEERDSIRSLSKKEG